MCSRVSYFVLLAVILLCLQDWAINQRRVRQLLRVTEQTMKSEVVEIGNTVAVQPVSDTFTHPDGYEMVSPHIPPAVPQRDTAAAAQCVIC